MLRAAALPGREAAMQLEQAKKAQRPHLGDEDGPVSTWGFEPGDRIVPDLYAWDLLGSGRRHETWLAWSVSRWAHVVVKLPRRDVPAPAGRDALVREAMVGGWLSHPSIVRLLDARVSYDQQPPHIVYEYVEGPTLDQALDEHGALAPADAIRLGMQIASTLHYLHGSGFVHLDLKPGNLALREGRAVLLDFDIAVPIGATRSGNKPRGTPCYMAPEQIRCRPAAPSMDLWALGAVLYETVTGRRAFEVVMDGEHRVFPQLAERPARPNELAPSVGEDLDRAIVRLLDPDPMQRPPTAMAVLNELEASLPPGEEGLWPTWADVLMDQASPTRRIDGSSRLS